MTEIDAVITWVDGDDAQHAARRRSYDHGAAHQAATSPTRFASRGELEFCVLSILQFCPFIDNIFIVTDNQDPTDLHHLIRDRHEWRSKVKIVNHEDLFGEHRDLLPVFSSRSIETMIHRIPGLHEHFVYFNDDIFIGRPLTPEFFFRSGMPVLRGSFRRNSPLLRWFKNILKSGAKRPGFNDAQRKAGEMVGYAKRYLVADHLPYPMRRSVLAAYFEARTADLRRQAGHRFRDEAQMSPIGLANHLELRAGAPVETNTSAAFIKPPRDARAWRRALIRLEALCRGELDAVCIQSLDQFQDVQQVHVLSCLDARYGRDRNP